MKRDQMSRMQWFLTTLATLGVIVAPMYGGEPPVAMTHTSESLLDVALDPTGDLQARLLNTASDPLAGRRVEVVKNGQVIAHAETDELGRLTIPGLTGGVYQLRTANTTCVFRVWTNTAAPPSAVTNVAMTETGIVVRGQGACDCGSCTSCTGTAPVGFAPAEPIMIAALLAAAIAVPIAVHNSGSDSPSGS